MKKIYLIALIFAILTGVAIYNYAIFLQNSAKKDMVFVVVAAKGIPQGTLVKEDMVERKQLPAESVNSLAIKDVSKVVGKITNMPIETNEQILTSKLNEKGTDNGGLAFLVPNGKRAITVEVDEISGVAGNIKKGNHVDIVASLMMDSVTPEGKAEKVAKTLILFQDVEVIAVGSVSADSKSSSGGYKNITLAVSPEQAVKLFYAQTSGKLTVILRPVLETDISDVAPYEPAA